MSTVSRNQEVGKRCISRGGFRTASTHGHKRPDVQEPGLHSGLGACAEFAGRAPRTPQRNIRAESVLFVFVTVPPGPWVRCAALRLGRRSPDGGRRALRSVGVMDAAMDQFPSF